MNVAILMGRLTRDPELKYTSNGKAYTTFTLAVQKTKDEAEFIDCVAWEKTAENIAEYFGKGNRILIQGRLNVSNYEQNGEKRKFTRVQAFNFEFIDSKNSGNSQSDNRNNYEDDEDEVFPFD
jgi:single-strand binding protein